MAKWLKNASANGARTEKQFTLKKISIAHTESEALKKKFLVHIGALNLKNEIKKTKTTKIDLICYKKGTLQHTFSFPVKKRLSYPENGRPFSFHDNFSW